MKSTRTRSTAPACLAAASALIVAGAAQSAEPQSAGPQSAQTAAAAGLSREQVNPAQQVAPSRRQRPVDVFSGPTREGCTLSDDPSVSFVLKQAVIDDDAKILTDREKQAVLADLIGRRITPRQLCDIRDRLAARIFRRGVLARVNIPTQTISGGVVVFHVFPARIQAVRIDGDVGPVQGKIEAYLSHLRRRNVFNLDQVQRWLLIVNDLPGVQAVASVVHSTSPGAGPGALDLVVTLRRTEIDETGLIANYNAKTLGPWSGLARVDINSLTGLGEQSSITAYTTLGNERQAVLQVTESARLGSSGLYTLASFSYGRARPGNVLAPLDLTGQSYVGTIEADYPLIRLQRRTLMIAGGMDFVNQDTRLPDNQALADDALRVLWGRVAGSISATDRPWRDNLVSTTADLTVQVRKGLDVLGASQPGARGLSNTLGLADSWVVRAEGHAAIRIAPRNVHYIPVTLSAHFLGQWADRPLLGYEQQGIGNLTIGRGYDPSAASADEIVALGLRADLGPIRVGRRLQVSPYVFGDTAHLSYLTAQPDVTVHSVGGGMSFRVPYDARGNAVRIDAGYARPLDKAIRFAVKNPPELFLVQIIVTH
jgi:hemolysin activation/secretion protein